MTAEQTHAVSGLTDVFFKYGPYFIFVFATIFSYSVYRLESQSNLQRRIFVASLGVALAAAGIAVYDWMEQRGQERTARSEAIEIVRRAEQEKERILLQAKEDRDHLINQARNAAARIEQDAQNLLLSAQVRQTRRHVKVIALEVNRFAFQIENIRLPNYAQNRDLRLIHRFDPNNGVLTIVIYGSSSVEFPDVRSIFLSVGIPPDLTPSASSPNAVLPGGIPSENIELCLKDIDLIDRVEIVPNPDGPSKSKILRHFRGQNLLGECV